MHLSSRIAESGLSNAVAQTFADGLKQVARADGPENDVERQLIDRLVDVLWTSDADPAPFEALWSCAELFLTACVYVAVADGEYAVEEARRMKQVLMHDPARQRYAELRRQLTEATLQTFEDIKVALIEKRGLDRQRADAMYADAVAKTKSGDLDAQELQVLLRGAQRQLQKVERGGGCSCAIS